MKLKLTRNGKHYEASYNKDGQLTSLYLVDDGKQISVTGDTQSFKRLAQWAIVGINRR